LNAEEARIFKKEKVVNKTIDLISIWNNYNPQLIYHCKKAFSESDETLLLRCGEILKEISIILGKRSLTEITIQDIHHGELLIYTTLEKYKLHKKSISELSSIKSINDDINSIKPIFSSASSLSLLLNPVVNIPKFIGVRSGIFFANRAKRASIVYLFAVLSFEICRPK
jgi:hypothetical protein